MSLLKISLLATIAVTVSVSSCSSNVDAMNAAAISKTSVELNSAAKKKGQPQSTFVTRLPSGQYKMSPITNTRDDFFGDIKPSGVSQYVDCNTGGSHTSTECNDGVCVTEAISACLSGGGTAEWCSG